MNQEIKELLEKFYRGETTIEEEQAIQDQLQAAGKDELSENLMPDKEMFSFFSEQRSQLDKKFDQRNQTENLDINAVAFGQNRSSSYLKYAAAAGLFILGFATAWVIQHNNQDELEAEYSQNIVTLYEGIISTTSTISSDRIQFLKGLVLEESSLMEILLSQEEDYHVKVSIIRQIQDQYTSEETLKIVDKVFKYEKDPIMLVALIKILVELDEHQAIERVQEIIENKSLDSETELAIKTLIS